MKIVILYESFFTNTRQIAESMFTKLSPRCEVEMCHVHDFRSDVLRQCDLLIVGSPTRAFRPVPTVVSCLKSIQDRDLTGMAVATFDTRIPENSVNGFVRMLMRLFGYAAKPLATLLTQKGGILLAPPEGFLVNDTEGPLREKERERAGVWAVQLVDLLSEKRKL